MKILKSILTFFLIFSLFACSVSTSKKLHQPGSDDDWWKYVQLEVLRVYSAKDGNALYRAYLVKWKDQEVVVRDSLSRTEYNVGDIITLIAMSHSHSDDYALLSFEVVSPDVVDELNIPEPIAPPDTEGLAAPGVR